METAWECAVVMGDGGKVNLTNNPCTSKQTGKLLAVYDSEYEARQGADYANSAYGNDLVPYQCRSCGRWHLSPKSRQTLSSKCPDCTDRSGRRKDLYATREDAERRADILCRERGVSLGVYRCPYHDGWHLTKGC